MKETIQRKEAIQLIALARHYEALSARAWPAEKESYDGLFVKRSTPNFPSLRANCVMPLDPADHDNIKKRLDQLCYDEMGIFQYPIRQTPLCPKQLLTYMQENGWGKGEDILCMGLKLQNFVAVKLTHSVKIEEISAKDYVALSAKIYKGKTKPEQAYLEIIARMKAKPFFWQFSYGNEIIGNILSVHDYNKIGLLDFAIKSDYRCKGFGHAALQNLLIKFQQDFALPNKQDIALWLQVETLNKNAIKLYKKMGFESLYSIAYWSLK